MKLGIYMSKFTVNCKKIQTDAEVAACKVDQPPKNPSIMGATMINLWPWLAKILCGVDTKTNVRSLDDRIMEQKFSIKDMLKSDVIGNSRQ